VRMGMPASALVHPLTGKPLQEAAEAAAPAPPSAAAARPASGCDSDKPTAAWDDEPIPVPEDASEEDKEMLRLVGATLRSFLRAGLKPPTVPSPPT
jgi:ribosomal protein L12E/L44/L45/RPP1/RPP2